MVRRKDDGMVHFLGGHHLKVPVKRVEPNVKCLNCGIPVYRFMLSSGRISKPFMTDGEPHKCAMDPKLKYKNRRHYPEKDSVGYFGDHAKFADRDEEVG